MIVVRLKEYSASTHPNGVHAVPDEHGWISILDDDGLVLGMYHKDRVVEILIRVGEKDGDSRAGPGIDSDSKNNSGAK